MTLFVPVVIADDMDADKTIASSEFRKVAQVVRALRSVDDGFEVRISKLAIPSGERNASPHGIPKPETSLDFDSLPENFKRQLEAKVIKLGLGLKAEALSIPSVKLALLTHRQKCGYWETPRCEAPVPGMPNDLWASLAASIYAGCRNMPPGHTLSSLTQPLREEYGELSKYRKKPDFDLNVIYQAIRSTRTTTGKWPRCDDNQSPVPGLPGETWTSINRPGMRGHRGIPKGMVLQKLCNALSPEFNETARSSKLSIRIIQVAVIRLKKLGKNLEHLDPNIDLNDTTAIKSSNRHHSPDYLQFLLALNLKSDPILHKYGTTYRCHNTNACEPIPEPQRSS